ncbi:MAG: pectin esterase, partial [Rhodothermaceae bacterium]|nr:pectin esterase [Rhodothermaceae bacterium]
MTRALPLLLAGLAVTAASAQTATVRVENPTGAVRPDEVVSVAWDALTRRVPGLSPDRVRAVDSDDADVPTQVFDADGDGSPDELLLLVSLWPGQSRAYTVAAGPPASV